MTNTPIRSGGSNANDEKNGKNNDEKISKRTRDLAVSILSLLLVVYVLFALTRAWMVSSGGASAKDASVRVQGLSSIDFELYMWDEDAGQWGTTQLSFLDFENVVPNELRRYKLVASGGFSAAHFNFSYAGEYADLYPYLYIRETTDAEDGDAVASGVIPIRFGLDTVVGPSNDFETLMNGTSGFTLQNSGADTTCIFDVYIHKDVCNCFELYGLSGTLELTTDTP